MTKAKAVEKGILVWRGVGMEGYGRGRNGQQADVKTRGPFSVKLPAPKGACCDDGPPLRGKRRGLTLHSTLIQLKSCSWCLMASAEWQSTAGWQRGVIIREVIVKNVFSLLSLLSYSKSICVALSPRPVTVN